MLEVGRHGDVSNRDQPHPRVLDLSKENPRDLFPHSVSNARLALVGHAGSVGAWDAGTRRALWLVGLDLGLRDLGSRIAIAKPQNRVQNSVDVFAAICDRRYGKRRVLSVVESIDLGNADIKTIPHPTQEALHHLALVLEGEGVRYV